MKRLPSASHSIVEALAQQLLGPSFVISENEAGVESADEENAGHNHRPGGIQEFTANLARVRRWLLLPLRSRAAELAADNVSRGGGQAAATIQLKN
jgi:hypothetical protein